MNPRRSDSDSDKQHGTLGEVAPFLVNLGSKYACASACLADSLNPKSASGDAFRVWMLRVNTPATSKIRELQNIPSYKDVLWLYIAMEDPIVMHVLHSSKKLVHQALYLIFGQKIVTSSNEIVGIHLHQIEDQTQLPSWWVAASSSVLSYISDST